MIDQATNRPLGSLASPTTPPTVVRIDDRDVVVLRTTPSGIEVWRDGAIITFPPQAMVQVIDDPVRIGAVLHRSLVAMNAVRRQTIQAQHDQRQQHTALFDDIRRYAIEKYDADNYGRARLDHFLETIGLEPYVELIRVSYEIAGSYAVTAVDETTARHDVGHGLGVDVTSIPEAILDTAEAAAKALQIDRWSEEQASQVGASAALTVHFQLDGSYDTGTDDRDDAADQCRSDLLLDVTGIRGLMAHTMTWRFSWIEAEFVD